MSFSAQAMRFSRIGMSKTIARPLSSIPKFSSATRSNAIAAQARTFSRTSRARAAQVPPPQAIETNNGGIRWGRLVLGTLFLTAAGGVAYLSYTIYDQRHPNEQAPADATKKTLVILGSGWGSVSLLKKLDTENYNVVVISPRNYFLFTPLLPSCPTGTIEHRSIMEPIRHIVRHKKTQVKYYEAEATSIDHEKRVIRIQDLSDIKGDVNTTEVPFDYLVIGVGAESATFGIPGVREHACFLKEIGDSQKLRKNVMDCIETALFKEQSPEEIERLLHMVVVGGGPTGVEFAAELQDFFESDLKKWMPELADKFKVTLVEALPNVLPMFSKALIDYTEKSFRDEQIEVKTKTMVKNVSDKHIEVEVVLPDGSREKQEIPYGCLVWATGNAVRPVVKDLMNKIPEQKNARRGLSVNEYLVVDGTEGIWALGDCSQSKYAPTAQVASQQGAYLARLFNNMEKKEAVEHEIAELKELEASTSSQEDIGAIKKTLSKKERELKKVGRISSFEYTHQGSLAYIGMDRAVADISLWGGNIASAGGLTFLFWRSAYLSMVFSTRNRILVIMDWLKVKVFGRDVSRE